jgi:hypothetical protein
MGGIAQQGLLQQVERRVDQRRDLRQRCGPGALDKHPDGGSLPWRASRPLELLLRDRRLEGTDRTVRPTAASAGYERLTKGP